MEVISTADLNYVLEHLYDRFATERTEALSTFHDIKAKRLEWQMRTIVMVQRKLKPLLQELPLQNEEG